MKYAWLVVLAVVGHGAAQAAPVAIIGGTVVDVRDFGRSTQDVVDAVVVIDGDAIVAVGPAASVAIPPGARIIDAHGGFVVPGLIDGAGALRSQGFAAAYLYDGVTTVYVPEGGDGEPRPPFAAAPGPRIVRGAPITGYASPPPA